MNSETVIGMHGEGFHWPFVLMIVILVLAIMGIVFLTRYFFSPVDVSTLGSASRTISYPMIHPTTSNTIPSW
jgi:hypothetical protein